MLHILYVATFGYCYLTASKTHSRDKRDAIQFETQREAVYWMITNGFGEIPPLQVVFEKVEDSAGDV